ncbi:MAG: hypothetical protein WC288_01965 [Candidatus Paceibacterota bacterium]|jgi:hypothetical protein
MNIKEERQTKKELEKEASKLWQIACSLKWGNKCEVSGNPASTFHHFIYRSRCKAMTYDVMNGVPVSKEIHNIIHFSRYDDQRYEVLNKIIKKRGEDWFNYVKAKRLESKPFNIRNIDWLKEQIKNLKEFISKYEHN